LPSLANRDVPHADSLAACEISKGGGIISTLRNSSLCIISAEAWSTLYFLATVFNVLSSELDNSWSGLIETHCFLSIIIAAFEACALGSKNAKKSVFLCLVLV